MTFTGLIKLAAGSGEYRYMVGRGINNYKNVEAPNWNYPDLRGLLEDITYLQVLTGETCTVQFNRKGEWKLIFTVMNFEDDNRVIVLGGESINPVMDQATPKNIIEVVDYTSAEKHATVAVLKKTILDNFFEILSSVGIGNS